MGRREAERREERQTSTVIRRMPSCSKRSPRAGRVKGRGGEKSKDASLDPEMHSRYLWYLGGLETRMCCGMLMGTTESQLSPFGI